MERVCCRGTTLLIASNKQHTNKIAANINKSNQAHTTPPQSCILLIIPVTASREPAQSNPDGKK